MSWSGPRGAACAIKWVSLRRRDRDALSPCPRERDWHADGLRGKHRCLRLRQRVRNSLLLGCARAGLPPALERRIDPMDIGDAYQDGGYRHSKCEQIAIFDWSDHGGGNDQAEAQHRQMREIDRV